MRHFIEELTGTGQVQLEHDLAPELDGWADALCSVDALARLELPGEAPAFSEAAALWGAEMCYQACRCTAFRSLSEADVAEAFARPGPEPANASCAYSVDLSLRYLPDVVRIARGIAAEDPLNHHLLRLAQDWPLSSVGVKGVSKVEVGCILDNRCLRQMYLDRILKTRDRSRVEEPRVAEAVKRSLGVFNHYLYAVIGHGVIVWNTETGEYLGALEWERDNWAFHKRFFRVKGRWCQLIIENQAPRFEPVHLTVKHQQVVMGLTTFDDEWPLALLENWTFVDFDGMSTPCKVSGTGVAPIRRVEGFSKNGLLIQVQDQKGRYWQITKGPGGLVKPMEARPVQTVVPEPGIMMKLGVDRVLRNQFNRVAISAGGQIILESKKLHHWSLLPNAALDRLILARTTTLPDAEKRNLDFKPLLKTSAPPDSRVGLRTAECGASIRIFVDSRGMLHVKPKQRGA